MGHGVDVRRINLDKVARYDKELEAQGYLPFLSAREAAELLGYCELHLLRLLRKGTVSGTRPGPRCKWRVRRSEIAKILASTVTVVDE